MTTTRSHHCQCRHCGAHFKALRRSRKRCDKCALLYFSDGRRRLAYWHTFPPVCRECKTSIHSVNRGNKQYCDECMSSRIREKRRLSARVSARKYWLSLPIKACATCGQPMRSRRSTYCSDPHCKPAIAPSESPLFRINGMTCSEFTFYTVMTQQGKRLEYLRQGQTKLFKWDSTGYTPDFRDDDGMYYEVVGTRQAYSQAYKKYQEFRQQYPDVPFRIVLPCGKEYPHQKKSE